MSATDDLGALNSDQWRDLCERAGRLEKTLQAGAATVDLRGFLPPPEAPHRRAVLLELIKTELEARYRKGRGATLEAFLAQYPELGGRDGIPAGLIYEEYRVRHLHGDRPELAAYRGRFPRQFEELERLLRDEPVPEGRPGPEALPPTGYSTIRPLGEWRKPESAPHGPAPVDPPTPPHTAKDNGPAPEVRPPTSAPSPLKAPLPPPAPAPEPRRDLVLSGGEGYQKIERLGTGEFGEVWRARAPGGVEVAIKIILRTLDHAASQRELKALEKIRELRHPFLLQTHQYQAEKDHLVIVMELADGSLHDRYKECKALGMPGIPVDELVTYFSQAAEALDYLHSQHVSHRDIKPQNLLMLRGYAKVADFGLARWQDQMVDQASIVCGTPHYMAPEAWKQQVSNHSDQYSLASAYAEMRLGRRLFPGNSLFEVAEHHMKTEPQLDPLPAPEAAVLRRALAKEPDQRFPSCGEFTRALRDAVTPKVVSPARSSWPVKASVAALVLALAGALGVLGFVMTRTDRETNPPPKLWLAQGWEPEDIHDVIQDPRSQRDYYRRLVRPVGDQKVVMVAVPQSTATDPPLFYVMENKAWNTLYAAYEADPKSSEIVRKYQSRPGGRQWFRGEWEKGAHAPALSLPALGVAEGRGEMPVFRVTVTEAHCFAEWLGGRLPRRDQWLKAAGQGEDPRSGPFSGSIDSLPVNLGRTGPWSVRQGDQDLSIHGCRQMAGNGKEWTRTMHDAEEIPLAQMNGARPVLVCGQSYAAQVLLTFERMSELDDKSCTENDPEISFRVVLEP